MRVVLDTNVLVSGLLTPAGPAAQVVHLVLTRRLQIVLDDRVISEYRRVLTRERFRFEPHKVVTLLTDLEAIGERVTAGPLAVPLPDPTDTPFLEVALEAKAEALVTRNTRHYPPKE